MKRWYMQCRRRKGQMCTSNTKNTDKKKVNLMKDEQKQIATERKVEIEN